MEAYNGFMFRPPAPLARVTLRQMEGAREATGVPMLIDTGADITAVPRTAVVALQEQPFASRLYEIGGLSGQSNWLSAIKLDLILANQTFRGQFVIVEQDWGIIGRNLLNQLPVFLNGPFLSWQIAE